MPRTPNLPAGYRVYRLFDLHLNRSPRKVYLHPVLANKLNKLFKRHGCDLRMLETMKPEGVEVEGSN